MRTGLLDISTSHRAAMALSSMLSVSNQDLPGLLRFSRGTPLELFAYAFRLSPPGTLNAEHYSHVRQPLTIAERYLSKVLAQPRPGVNILLYGPPGTGKTQLSRLLAKPWAARCMKWPAPIASATRYRQSNACVPCARPIACCMRNAPCWYWMKSKIYSRLPAPKPASARRRAGSTACWKKTRCRASGSATLKPSTLHIYAASTWSSKSRIRPWHSVGKCCANVAQASWAMHWWNTSVRMTW